MGSMEAVESMEWEESLPRHAELDSGSRGRGTLDCERGEDGF